MQRITGAVPAAPDSIDTAPRSHASASRNRAPLTRALLLAFALAVGLWGLLNGPWYQEWRLSRMPLQALQKQIGADLEKVADARLLYFTGLRLNEQGRFSEADPILRRAVGLDPDSPRIRDEWAKALLGSGLTTAAFGELKEFAARHDESPQAHFLLGKFYFTQRSMRRAAEEFDRTLARQPDNAECWSYLIGARDAQGDTSGALKAAERATALRPDNAGDHLLYASLLARSNRNQDARREFARAIELGPRMTAAHREYAVWLFAAGSGDSDRRTAESEVRKALFLDPLDSQSHLTLGRIRIAEGKPEEAKEPLRKASELAPDDPAAPLALAQLWRAAGDSSESERWEQVYLERQRYAAERTRLLDRIRVNPGDSEPHTQLARLLGLHGDVAGCIHHHSMALHLAIDAPRTMIAACNDLCDGGHAADALPLARRAELIAANNPAAHEALGNALLGMGQVHLAGVEYNKTAAWWPNRTAALKAKLDSWIRNRSANPSPAELVYREARQLESERIGPKRMTPEVEKLAQRAAELEPVNPNYLWFLFKVQMARRENDAAIATGRRILNVARDDGRAHAMLAVLLCEKASKPDEFAAIEKHLEQAAAEPAAAATWRYGLGLLALMRRQGARAEKELKAALELDPASDVIHYKLSQAAEMAGDHEGAVQAMAEVRKRQDSKRRQMEFLGDVAQHPNDRRTYERAAALFDSDGLHAQATAIRAAERRRFDRKDGKPFGVAEARHQSDR